MTIQLSPLNELQLSALESLSAGLNREQLLWINGYFQGMLDPTGSNEVNALLSDFVIQYSEIEVYKNTPVEQFVSGMFDAYLFFSPTGIDNFKASSNFPNPSSVVLANENDTAREAWKLFTNKVYLSPENEELSFVQYSYTRWIKENN